MWHCGQFCRKGSRQFTSVSFLLSPALAENKCQNKPVPNKGWKNKLLFSCQMRRTGDWRRRGSRHFVPSMNIWNGLKTRWVSEGRFQRGNKKWWPLVMEKITPTLVCCYWVYKMQWWRTKLNHKRLYDIATNCNSAAKTKTWPCLLTAAFKTESSKKNKLKHLEALLASKPASHIISPSVLPPSVMASL